MLSTRQGKRRNGVRVLVTGGTGFIGYHTALELLKAGHEVRLLVRSVDKARKLFGDRVDDIVTGDIADANGVRRALTGCDAVVHTAAMVSVDRKDAQQVFETNMNGTRNTIGQAVDLGLDKILHVSSVTAIFDEKADSLNENSPPGTAKDAYGRSKVACEKYVRDLQDRGAPIQISYPASVIGPDDPGLTEPHAGLMGNLVASFLMPGGNQWVDVRDVAYAHLQMLELDLPPGRYCLGGHFLSWRDLSKVLRELTGRRLLTIPVFGVTMRSLGRVVDVLQPILGADIPLTHEAMVYATKWVSMDNRKAERELGVHFRPVEESLTTAIHWLEREGHISAQQAGKLSLQ
jgi:nucleoside-diphosphate-sugar epimerase